MRPLVCFPSCTQCTGPMEWNEELQCWCCYGCEETQKRRRKIIPKAGILAQLYDGERAS